jgi:hypothetical protein
VETGPNGELTFVAITNGVALPLPGSLPLVLLGLWAVAGCGPGVSEQEIRL